MNKLHICVIGCGPLFFAVHDPPLMIVDIASKPCEFDDLYEYGDGLKVVRFESRIYGKQDEFLIAAFEKLSNYILEDATEVNLPQPSWQGLEKKISWPRTFSRAKSIADFDYGLTESIAGSSPALGKMAKLVAAPAGAG